jgi:hypothetical protein
MALPVPGAGRADASSVEEDRPGAELPPGWRLPSESELSDPWRKGTGRDAAVALDCNGDGTEDLARLVVAPETGEEGLLARVSGSKGGAWQVLDRSEMGRTVHMGLAVSPPGEVTACEPDGCDAPRVRIRIPHGAFEYFRPESAASVFVCEADGEIRRYWLSD